LTNILRDVHADALAGRIYVPQQDLRRFGVSAEDLVAGRYTPEFLELMTFEAGVARRDYERARAALPPGGGGRLFAAEIMGRTYFALLRAIETRRFHVFGTRVSLPTYQRIGIALGCWLRTRWDHVRPRVLTR